MVDRNIIDPFGEEIWESESSKVNKNIEDGYIYVPYVFTQTISVISESDFAPKISIKSRYSSTSMTNFRNINI